VLFVPFFDVLLVLVPPYRLRYFSTFRRHWLMRGRAIINCTTGIRTEFGGLSFRLKRFLATRTYMFMQHNGNCTTGA
jgi:hypothetical protein